jgi:hypothetical protein
MSVSICACLLLYVPLLLPVFPSCCSIFKDKLDYIPLTLVSVEPQCTTLLSLSKASEWPPLCSVEHGESWMAQQYLIGV